ncbi:hypothetical protein VNO77_18903 [Canavalia gladiata]|uniref:Uncharacterized protein n=1 Tax=Canavalia gladiata TaxID=3824 RepID=A0AAN9QP42_CANGL
MQPSPLLGGLGVREHNDVRIWPLLDLEFNGERKWLSIRVWEERGNNRSGVIGGIGGGDLRNVAAIHGRGDYEQNGILQ